MTGSSVDVLYPTRLQCEVDRTRRRFVRGLDKEPSHVPSSSDQPLNRNTRDAQQILMGPPVRTESQVSASMQVPTATLQTTPATRLHVRSLPARRRNTNASPMTDPYDEVVLPFHKHQLTGVRSSQMIAGLRILAFDVIAYALACISFDNSTRRASL